MVKKKKRRAQLPFRLNILFFVVFLLFSGLIVRLGYVQIVYGEQYQEEIDRTIKDTTKIPVPRGRILDRNHNVVVGNKPLYAITYTPAKGTTAEDRLEVAKKLAPYIDMVPEEDELTLRNKKEYWYLSHEDEVKSRLTVKEIEELDNGEEYQTMLDRITEKEVSGFTKEEKEIINIKTELDKAYSLTPHIVKNEDVTPKEYARVAEHLDELPGINATTDWERTHPYDGTLRSIFGSITTREQGIPKERKDYYTSRGYSRNDRVGISGLEQEYESVLRGRKEQIQYTTNKDGVIVDSEVVVEGERGKDLVLTIDMELQKKVDQILQDEIKKALAEDPYGNRFMEDAYAVVMDPQTGELLAVSGQHYDKKKNEFSNRAYNTLHAAYRAGSTVKGATVLSGYESGVIEPGQRFFDAPIKIKGTPEKSSYQNESLGWVNDYTALQKSSNVYMFYIAMRLAGDFDYQRNEKLQIDSVDDSFQEFRNYFSQFGLGVPTGVDFPFESVGFEGVNSGGKLLDFAIGQYDTYTTMQLAQYVSTIANDGYRVRPRFLDSIRRPTPYQDELGPVYKSKNTDALNRITMDQNLIERVQEGFRQVFQEPGGTAYSYFADKEYTSAGKTGTAEAVYIERYDNGEIKKIHETSNLSLVGYAPYDNPEVAFAIVVPDTGGEYHLNDYIGERILDTYFNLKEKRSEENKEVTNEVIETE
ncbi:peptidoglycan D,D-transpeptidase FtsI family protein [Virgibacillus necropolis]|uniref:serine-type D-Ala-D-Ala carboxypeptidase n=1 Tax=Virgibacillus necropolis TaxID=163877 RepID=A0A221MC55_9BACI|nr:penicillin-binding protein 2 [Virgibacillus necropolis]ASN05221.1 penicillin-binding protein [Virgibacillus necropolis]